MGVGGRRVHGIVWLLRVNLLLNAFIVTEKEEVSLASSSETSMSGVGTDKIVSVKHLNH